MCPGIHSLLLTSLLRGYVTCWKRLVQVAQGCDQGPQGFGSTDKEEQAVNLEVEMGEGVSGQRKALSASSQDLPVLTDALEWNRERW